MHCEKSYILYLYSNFFDFLFNKEINFCGNVHATLHESELWRLLLKKVLEGFWTTWGHINKIIFKYKNKTKNLIKYFLYCIYPSKQCISDISDNLLSNEMYKWMDIHQFFFQQCLSHTDKSFKSASSFRTGWEKGYKAVRGTLILLMLCLAA